MNENDEDINTKYGRIIFSLVRSIIHLKSYDMIDKDEAWMRL